MADESSVLVTISEFAKHQSFHDLPSTVVSRAKQIVLDTVGVLIRGTSAPSLRKLRNSLVTCNSGQSTVLGSQFKAMAPLAALLNGSLATITQFNEGHRPTMGQPAIHIFPAAYAVAEERGSTGQELINALVTGYEVAARVGLCLFPMNPRIHPQGHFASIGAAVAVGKLLQFDARQFQDMLNSIANLCVFSWKQATASGGNIHHLSAGLGANHAVLAALAVHEGYVGPPGCFEQFFLPFSSSEPKLEKLIDGLGTRHEILNNYFKWYPICAHIHSSIEALEQILQNNPVSAPAVRSIDVRTFPSAFDLVDKEPKNTLGAIFSIPYCLAMWLLKREVDVHAIANESPLDPAILQVASRISVEVDPLLEPVYPKGRPSLVRVSTTDGRVYEAFVSLPRESATDEDLRNKFLRATEPVLGRSKAQDLLPQILRLESISHLMDISRLLR